MGKFLVLDADTDLFDKDETVLSQANYDSSVVDVSGFNSSDMVCSMGVAIHWPDIDSGGAATVILVMLSDDTLASPSTVIQTSKTFTLAEAQAAFGGADGYILPVPNAELGDYFMFRITVGDAALTAGVCTAGLVPMPT